MEGLKFWNFGKLRERLNLIEEGKGEKEWKEILFLEAEGNLKVVSYSS